MTTQTPAAAWIETWLLNWNVTKREIENVTKLPELKRD